MPRPFASEPGAGASPFAAARTATPRRAESETEARAGAAAESRAGAGADARGARTDATVGAARAVVAERADICGGRGNGDSV